MVSTRCREVVSEQLQQEVGSGLGDGESSAAMGGFHSFIHSFADQVLKACSGCEALS